MSLLNNFGFDKKYKLYRTVYEIVHPTISKKNISNYEIVFSDKLNSVRVFYPKKVSSISSVIIYIHGEGYEDCKNSYVNICTDMAKKTDMLVLGLDYKVPIDFDKCLNTVKYLYEELSNINILNDNIVLVGDSLGANLVNYISLKLNNINKKVLISPILDRNGENKGKKNRIDLINKYGIFNGKFDLNEENINSKTLIVVGATDNLENDIFNRYKSLEKNKNINLLNITFSDHNFLCNGDPDAIDEFYNGFNNYLKR